MQPRKHSQILSQRLSSNHVTQRLFCPSKSTPNWSNQICMIKNQPELCVFPEGKRPGTAFHVDYGCVFFWCGAFTVFNIYPGTGKSVPRLLLFWLHKSGFWCCGKQMCLDPQSLTVNPFLAEFQEPSAWKLDFNVPCIGKHDELWNKPSMM